MNDQIKSKEGRHEASAGTVSLQLAAFPSPVIQKSDPTEGAEKMLRAFTDGAEMAAAIITAKDMLEAPSVNRGSIALDKISAIAAERVREFGGTPESCSGIRLSGAGADEVISGVYGQDPKSLGALKSVKALIDEGVKGGEIGPPTQSFRLAA